MDKTTNMLLKLPFALEWVVYKGVDLVAQINYEATKKAGKPMLDLSYCMTRALNQSIDKTVQWDKSKFKESRFGKPFKKKQTKKSPPETRGDFYNNKPKIT